MNDKVKLPKEICEYIEDLLIGSTKEDFLAGVLGSANSPKYEAIKKHFKNDFDALLQALVIGWEVEQSPEEKLRVAFEYVLERIKCLGEDDSSADHFKGTKSGIIIALETLNIKIPGINT